MGQNVVTVGGDRIQYRPWRGRSDVAAVVPFAADRRVSSEVVEQCLSVLRTRGYESVYTSALTPGELDPFVANGFAVHEELHLLSRRLDDRGLSQLRRLRRARRQDWDRVLEIDNAAFRPFWRFDRAGLSDALAATPARRFRVTRPDPIVGYHIAGRAGSAGYVQRVAVHPDAQGQGWGLCLVNDALRWMQRSGARIAYVNTQLDNSNALALYEKAGFEVEARRLTVLERDLAVTG